MKLLSPDELSEEQRTVLGSYRAMLPEGSVCVNVLLGAETWDVRPLVLEGKQVSLCRFSRELPQARCKALAAELEGFSVLDACPGRVIRASGSTQFALMRPYVPATLRDKLDAGEIKPGDHNRAIAHQLFEILRSMQGCNLVHGHVCPANMAVVEGSLVLLDPLVGSVNETQDSTVPPELSPGEDLMSAADIFGLGVALQALLGSALTPEQQQMVRRMLLPSPRQRPTLEQAEQAFSLQATSLPIAGASRVIKRAAVEPPPAATAAAAPAVRSPFGRLALATATGLCAILAVKTFLPGVYWDIARRVPMMMPESDPALTADWSSGDRARMARVARRAVMDGDPGAESLIIDTIMAGENPPYTTPRLMRVALNDLWRDQLSAQDVRAVVRLTVAPAYKEGLDALPPLSSLHPGVILAVAGEMPPNDPAPQLKLLPLSIFLGLPDPFGSAFRQLGDLGVSTAGAPEAVSLAAIMSGQFSSRAFDAFMGTDSSPKNAVARLSILMPIVSGNEAAAGQLAASIRDRGGDMGQVLGWFDIEDLAQWSKVSGPQKLLLALNRLPEGSLTQAQYSDLMTFPLPGVREQAALELKKRFFRDTDGNLLLTLSGPGNRLSREQTIALVSALTLEAPKRPPFVAAWFGLKPAPDTVLLILLARSGYDSTDTFNLEAARYLRRTKWSATPEMLQLLAQHPEPLARTLAYSRLDPKDDAQRKVLQERISAEKDQGLLKMVMGKLSAELPQRAATPLPSAAPQ